MDINLKKKLLNNKRGPIDLNVLVSFMEETGIDFIPCSLKIALGVATYKNVYLDIKQLSKLYNTKMIAFIILHEIGHYKRAARMGKDGVLKALSDDDFERFSDHIVGEEIVADRYACLVYYKLYNDIFPRNATQQLDIELYRMQYKRTTRPLFGVIQNSDENYEKLLSEYICLMKK